MKKVLFWLWVWAACVTLSAAFMGCASSPTYVKVSTFEAHVAGLQARACEDIIGETCEVRFMTPPNYVGSGARAWVSCYPNPRLNDAIDNIVYYNQDYTNLAGLREVAYHEACHHYFFRKCGCPYGTTSQREEDANECRDLWMKDQRLPDWGCDGSQELP